MKFSTPIQTWLSIFAFAGAVLALPSAASAQTIVAEQPMQLLAEGQGVSGQLYFPPEIASQEMPDTLVFTITSPPIHGRVGLAGDDEEDFFNNTTARLSYFAYRPEDDYEGSDSFTYQVRNQITGLVYQSEVIIEVTPPPALEMDSFEVSTVRDRAVTAVPVTLQTRPNLAISSKIPSHEDFMSEADRLSIIDAKIAYVIDERAKPAHGTARLNRITGELSYSPDPGFIGEDHFSYYTFDENNQEIGVENSVVIMVEPIRILKTKVADRSSSREVDLVFVINNSPSMEPHQSRIAENLQRFRQLFETQDLDYRIGVITTDFVNAGARTYKRVRGTELDDSGQPVLDRKGNPRRKTKQVASNGNLVTLPVMPQPWITRQTPDSVFAELVKVGTNGDSNRTAFTSVYNFVADAYNGKHSLLRPEATTIVVFFMDEEETRMATRREARDGTLRSEWIENGTLPELLQAYNEKNPTDRQTLDGYINYWVLRPFIIVKGNQRGKIEMHAVVSPTNVSHRRAAELTGGTVLNIESNFSASLAALGDRIANTVAVALDPISIGNTLYQPSIRVLADGQEISKDPQNGYIYDELTHSIRFQGRSKETAFTAIINVTYEEHR